jgi:hypothetical protein
LILHFTTNFNEGVNYEKRIIGARIIGCHHEFDFGWLRLDERDVWHGERAKEDN